MFAVPIVSTYSWILIIITVLISISAFNNGDLFNRFILWPKYMNSPDQYYRLLSSGFIHSDWNHLIFNMLTMFFFGKYVETHFADLGRHEFFLVLYLAGIVVSSLPSFLKNRHNEYYRALGASGGVSAILFSFIYIAPWSTIYVLVIPVPAIIAGVGYLAYSAYMSGKGRDNIGHDAHFWGSVFGLVFTFVNDPERGQNFMIQLMHPHFSF